MARLPLVSPLDRALFLKAQPYLEGLPPRAIAALGQYTEERSFGRGEVVYEAGQATDHIHFLSSGRMRTQYPAAEPFDVAAPGGIGLVECLAESEAPPRVWAVEETFALSLGAGELVQLMEDDFLLYETLARSLARVGLDELRTQPPSRRAEPGFPPGPADASSGSLDLVHRIARAREAPFFRGSDLTVMTELLRFEEPRILEAGELLWERDSPVESLALVLDGGFVTSDGEQETRQPAGAMLGAWEVFSSEERYEDARAETRARVIEIDRTLFSDLLEDHFGFALDYLGKLARRLIALRYGSVERPSACDSESSDENASGSMGSGKSENGNGTRDSL